MSKKLFFLFALIALIASAALPGVAYADSARIKGPAHVSKLTLISVSPIALKILGDYTCDKITTASSVSGKTVSVWVYDTKQVGSGKPCGASKNFKTSVTIPGPLVPGVYTVLINPDGLGKAQKKLSVVVPVPPTPAPTAQP